MKTTVNWNEELYDIFCRKAMLPKFERDVLRLRIMEKSNSEIMDILHCSESTVIRKVNVLRQKYDKLQAKDNSLPKRRISEKETWMDTH